jgi:GH43 family beta-xylosidase
MSPLLPSYAADPWMVFHEGVYYYCESPDHKSIRVRKAKSLIDIRNDEGVTVWKAPSRGPNSNAVWAPELHCLFGKWYIYYAADDGKNRNHRMWVLESVTADPQGPYQCRGSIDLEGWAIDGTVLCLDEKKMFFIWSGWPGKRNGQQNLYIAPMVDPVTVKGPRTLLACPDQPWERVAMPICEAPQTLIRNGTIFVVYSASGSWTADYCLGLLVNRTGDVLNPAAWEKIGPVFKKSEKVWGVGHCCFVKSPCQSEDWIVYHAKSEPKDGWDDRRAHAQRFTWTAEGLPHFGTPLSPAN